MNKGPGVLSRTDSDKTRLYDNSMAQEKCQGVKLCWNTYYFYVSKKHFWYTTLLSCSPISQSLPFFRRGLLLSGGKRDCWIFSLFHFLPDFYAIVKGTLFPYLYSNHVPLQLHSSKGLMVELWPRRCGDFRFALLKRVRPNTGLNPLVIVR